MKQFASLFILILLGLMFSCNNEEGSARQEIRFSGKQNWTGEPAGLVFFNGRYHLFYQRNPSEAVSGNIGWGHAVSTDLIRWVELPDVFTADDQGQFYAGSVIVDCENTSGLGTDDNPVLIAYYTRYNSTGGGGVNLSYSTGMAYSRDEGMTWTHIPMQWTGSASGLRYPNVSWNKQLDTWVMTVSAGQTIRFYRSSDAIHWELMNEFGMEDESSRSFESSVLVSVKVEDSAESKWVLFINVNEGLSDGAPGTRYWIGSLDDSGFHVEQTKELWVDYGKDNYGGMVCNNQPDDKTIMIGWMNSWLYANLIPAQDGRRGSLTFPRELTLVSDEGKYVICSTPVAGLAGLYGKRQTVVRTEISGTQNVFNKVSVSGYPFVLSLKFDVSDSYAMWFPREYGIKMKTVSGKELKLAYRAEMNYYYIDRSQLTDNFASDDYISQIGAGYKLDALVDEWIVIVDRGSVEWFMGGRKVAVTSLYFENEPFEIIDCYTESGRIILTEASLIKIKL